ncbi:MAG: hypothetical protein AAGU74_05955 [Bacillota bacterium]
MLTVMVIALFGLIVAVDARKTLKGAGTKDKVVYLTLLGISFCVLILYSFDVPVPSPADPIKDAIDALFG